MEQTYIKTRVRFWLGSICPEEIQGLLHFLQNLGRWEYTSNTISLGTWKRAVPRGVLGFVNGEKTFSCTVIS
jgi:hypothetical protein